MQEHKLESTHTTNCNQVIKWLGSSSSCLTPRNTHGPPRSRQILYIHAHMFNVFIYCFGMWGGYVTSKVDPCLRKLGDGCVPGLF